jgi:hypothetical protein
VVAWAVVLLGQCGLALADPVGQITEFSAGLPSGSYPDGIAAGPAGNLWFTDPGSTRAIGRITPIGQITEFSTGLNGGSYPDGIAAGPDGNLWFADAGSTKAIGRVTPSGQMTEFSAGLNGGSGPIGIAAGPDGNLWFTDEGGASAVGRIGAGVSGASLVAPVVAGSGQQGTQQVCEGDRWADWAGQQPLAGAFAFDGYRWLRDGTAIAGQTRQSYTPSSGDIGHQLSCTATVTYPLLAVTDTATSAPVTVIPQSSGPQGVPGARGPAGKPGQVELVTCTTVTATVLKTRHGKRVRVKVTKQLCKAKLVSGPVKITIAGAADRASLTRAGVVYATGYAYRTRSGPQTRLIAARPLTPGRYTLTLTHRTHGRRITTRRQITIR